MNNILITGGQGDLAISLAKRLASTAHVENPSRDILDVTCCSSVQRYIGSRHIDVLINSAGTIHPERVADSKPELWIRDINVNIVGTYLASRQVLASNPTATVINIASMAAFGNYPDWSSYCASKAAVVTFSKCLAMDGYDVYCLCPGGFETKFRDKFQKDNTNLMSLDDVLFQIERVLRREYASGDVVLFRKGFFKLNPEWNM